MKMPSILNNTKFYFSENELTLQLLKSDYEIFYTNCYHYVIFFFLKTHLNQDRDILLNNGVKTTEHFFVYENLPQNKFSCDII